MKMVFDVAWLISRRPQGSAVTLAFCLALALAATAGCSKSSPPPQAVAPPVSSDSNNAQQAQAAAPVPVPGSQPVVVADPDDSQKTLQSLNRALMGWTIRNQRHPKTFEEFADSAGFQIPAPPAGKKYDLSARGFIILVNN